MKLKKHREDVRSLKMMQDNYVQDIARRYQRLILMAEETLSPFGRDYFYTGRRWKVVKDADNK